MNDGGWTEANVVAAAVRILGGAQKVADSLGVSRSQVYRWIKARTMAHATYFYVAKLASLSGIRYGFPRRRWFSFALIERKGFFPQSIVISGENRFDSERTQSERSLSYSAQRRKVYRREAITQRRDEGGLAGSTGSPPRRRRTGSD